jgi:hypothetical protein
MEGQFWGEGGVDCEIVVKPGLVGECSSHMSELAEWKKRLYQSASGLGPFAFQYQRHLDLCQQISFADFKRQFVDQLPESSGGLKEKSVVFLYEQCLQLLAERDTLRKARELMRDRSWHQARLAVTELLHILRAYSKKNPEHLLRRSLGIANKQGTTEDARKLIRKLTELQDQCASWEGWSELRNWREYYSDAVLGMDRYLLRSYPDFTKDRRADIISVAVNIMGIKESESKKAKKEVYSDAISRLLLRHQPAASQKGYASHDRKRVPCTVREEVVRAPSRRPGAQRCKD